MRLPDGSIYDGSGKPYRVQVDTDRWLRPDGRFTRILDEAERFKTFLGADAAIANLGPRAQVHHTFTLVPGVALSHTCEQARAFVNYMRSKGVKFAPSSNSSEEDVDDEDLVEAVWQSLVWELDAAEEAGASFRPRKGKWRK